MKKLSGMESFGKKVLSRTTKGKALVSRLKRENTNKEFLSEFGKAVLNHNRAETNVEIRHRFLIGLKEQYWKDHEDGNCTADALTILIESADRAIDHESSPM